MNILALDPSSTATGWAFMSQPHNVTKVGLILPNKKYNAFRRVALLHDQLVELFLQLNPDRVVIEAPSCRQYDKKKRGGYGLAVYGMAAGVAMSCAWGTIPDESHVCIVAPEDWTEGQSKARRQMLTMALMGRAYNQELDPGKDISDAVALGSWYLNKLVLEQGG